MLQEFAGEGIPLVAASVPADNFSSFLDDLLPLIMSKAVSLDCLIDTEVQFKSVYFNSFSALSCCDSVTPKTVDFSQLAGSSCKLNATTG